MTHDKAVEMINELRAAGYAVVMFTPEELENVIGGTNVDLESHMTEHGWDWISNMG